MPVSGTGADARRGSVIEIKPAAASQDLTARSPGIDGTIEDDLAKARIDDGPAVKDRGRLEVVRLEFIPSPGAEIELHRVFPENREADRTFSFGGAYRTADGGGVVDRVVSPEASQLPLDRLSPRVIGDGATEFERGLDFVGVCRTRCREGDGGGEEGGIQQGLHRFVFGFEGERNPKPPIPWNHGVEPHLGNRGDSSGYRSFFRHDPDDNVEPFPSARDAVPEPVTGCLKVADVSRYSSAPEEKPAAK